MGLIFQVSATGDSGQGGPDVEAVGRSIGGFVSIVMSDVRKFSGGYEVVRDLSLAIRDGELFAFLGPEGSGKSTILACCAGLTSPDAGTILINGHPAGQPSTSAEVGILFEQVLLDPNLTVEKNIAFQAGLQRLSADWEIHLQEVAAWLDLTDDLGQRLGRLSPGEQRRTDLARALIHRPTVLLLDEPVKGLDAYSSALIWQVIADQHSKGTTIVLSTDQVDTAGQADTVGILVAGRLLAQGTPADLTAVYCPPVLVLQLTDPLQCQQELAELGLEMPEADPHGQVIWNLDAGPARDVIAHLGDKVQDFAFRQASLDEVVQVLADQAAAAEDIENEQASHGVEDFSWVEDGEFHGVIAPLWEHEDTPETVSEQAAEDRGTQRPAYVSAYAAALEMLEPNGEDSRDLEEQAALALRDLQYEYAQDAQPDQYDKTRAQWDEDDAGSGEENAQIAISDERYAPIAEFDEQYARITDADDQDAGTAEFEDYASVTDMDQYYGSVITDDEAAVQQGGYGRQDRYIQSDSQVGPGTGSGAAGFGAAGGEISDATAPASGDTSGAGFAGAAAGSGGAAATEATARGLNHGARLVSSARDTLSRWRSSLKRPQLPKLNGRSAAAASGAVPSGQAVSDEYEQWVRDWHEQDTGVGIGKGTRTRVDAAVRAEEEVGYGVADTDADGSAYASDEDYSPAGEQLGDYGEYGTEDDYAEAAGPEPHPEPTGLEVPSEPAQPEHPHFERIRPRQTHPEPVQPEQTPEHTYSRREHFRRTRPGKGVVDRDQRRTVPDAEDFAGLARIHRLLPSRAAPDGGDDEMGERQAGWTPVERRPTRQRAQMGTRSRHESMDPGLDEQMNGYADLGEGHYPYIDEGQYGEQQDTGAGQYAGQQYAGQQYAGQQSEPGQYARPEGRQYAGTDGYGDGSQYPGTDEYAGIDEYADMDSVSPLSPYDLGYDEPIAPAKEQTAHTAPEPKRWSKAKRFSDTGRNSAARRRAALPSQDPAAQSSSLTEQPLVRPRKTPAEHIFEAAQARVSARSGLSPQGSDVSVSPQTDPVQTPSSGPEVFSRIVTTPRVRPARSVPSEFPADKGIPQPVTPDLDDLTTPDEFGSPAGYSPTGIGPVETYLPDDETNLPYFYQGEDDPLLDEDSSFSTDAGMGEEVDQFADTDVSRGNLDHLVTVSKMLKDAILKDSLPPFDEQFPQDRLPVSAPFRPVPAARERLWSEELSRPVDEGYARQARIKLAVEKRLDDARRRRVDGPDTRDDVS